MACKLGICIAQNLVRNGPSATLGKTSWCASEFNGSIGPLMRLGMVRSARTASTAVFCPSSLRPVYHRRNGHVKQLTTPLALRAAAKDIDHHSISTSVLGNEPSKLPQTAYGRVMSAQANYFRVKLLNTSESGTQLPEVELLCKARSVLGKVGRFVLVGDYVHVINIDWLDARGLVSSIEDRTTELFNPKIANVDHFALVFSLADPPFEPFQATRFLVEAESVGIPCTLILNKADLVDDAAVRANIARVREWGYDAVPVSVELGQGLDGLKEILVNKTTVLAGPSGVGKSSIINYLRREALSGEQLQRLQKFQEMMETESDWRFVSDESEDEGSQEEDSDKSDRVSSALEASTSQGVDSDASAHHNSWDGQSRQASLQAFKRGRQNMTDSQTEGQQGGTEGSLDIRIPAWASGDDKIYGAQAVANVGYKSRRGRHTTRNVVLLDMPGGGILADTPGFNYPSILKAKAATVQDYFPEIQALKAQSPCAFANCTHIHEPDCFVRDSPWERYEYYIRLLEEVREREEVENTKLQMQKRRRQGMVKQKQTRGGKDIQLARLDPKKHRRASRGSRKQAIRGLLDDVGSDDV